MCVCVCVCGAVGCDLVRAMQRREEKNQFLSPKCEYTILCIYIYIYIYIYVCVWAYVRICMQEKTLGVMGEGISQQKWENEEREVGREGGMRSE